MYCGGFKEVIMDLVVVCDRSNDMSTNVSFAVECFESAPNSAICILDQFYFVHVFCVAWVRGSGITVNPLFYFNRACPIIDFVGDIGDLRADIPYLANKGYLQSYQYQTSPNLAPWAYLADYIAIHLEVCIWMRLLRINELLDCNRSDCIFAVATL